MKGAGQFATIRLRIIPEDDVSLARVTYGKHALMVAFHAVFTDDSWFFVGHQLVGSLLKPFLSDVMRRPHSPVHRFGIPTCFSWQVETECKSIAMITQFDTTRHTAHL